MNYKPRLLIVEDESAIRERYARIMERPLASWAKESGIDGFAVDAVATSQEGRELIEKAHRDSQPYEAVLLDLRLPCTTKDLEFGKTDDEQGRNLLKEIKLHSMTAVVILTGYPSTENLVHAIRCGATDFLIKPLVDREAERMLFIRLVKAVGVTREAIHEKLQLERLLRYREQNSKEIRERTAKLVVNIVSQIYEQVNELAGTLLHRYGLDPSHDSEEPICQNLTTVREKLDEIPKTLWAETEDKKKSILQKVDLRSILEAEASRVQPCYFHRGVKLDSDFADDLKTKTAEPELRDIIAEILFSALVSCPETGTVKLSAKRSADSTDIVVSVVAPGESIAKKVVDYLQKGEPLSDELRDRWRDIAILRPLARDIGIRIRVERQKDRNHISLLIPVISNE